MTATHGALFAGYDGIGLALESLLDVELAWVSEWEGLPTDKRPEPAGPSAVLAHRFPHAPNLGDITKVDWADVPPVDIITGGSPCQDLSTAGSRRGMTDGTRSNLWVSMREAIATIRPSLVVWENVRGAYSANATSSLGSDPRRLDSVRRKRDGDPLLRALGRVLGDLADLGMDARWHGLPVSDPLIGGCHARFRVFLAAHPRDLNLWEWLESIGGGDRPAGGFTRALLAGRQAVDLTPTRMMPTPTTDDASNITRDSGEFGSLTRTAVGLAQPTLLPTPTTQDGANNGGPSQLDRNTLPLNAIDALLPTPISTEGQKATLSGAGRDGHHTYLTEAVGDVLRDGGKLLPTPAVNDMGEGKTLDWWDEWAPRQKAADGTPAPHGKSLAIEAQRLLPTPGTQDASTGRTTHAGGNPTLGGVVVGPNPVDVARTGGFAEDRLLPTPTSSVDSARHTTTTGVSHSGTTLTDAARLLPTPTAWEQRGDHHVDERNALPLVARRVEDPLLPAPTSSLGSGGQTSRSGDRQDEALLGGIENLLPTPAAADGTGGRLDADFAGVRPSGAKRAVTLHSALYHRWGAYAPAIARWEIVTGRPAPDPTVWSDTYRRNRARRLAGEDPRPVGRRGSLKPQSQLSARFVEWMMGLPEGWVTDVPGVTRNQALKALGNGVVPQQAATAVAIMLDQIVAHLAEEAA
jgi:site-specific DNA-cytosine methylase